MAGTRPQSRKGTASSEPFFFDGSSQRGDWGQQIVGGRGAGGGEGAGEGSKQSAVAASREGRGGGGRGGCHLEAREVAEPMKGVPTAALL